jgi:hypothetical protein
VAGNDEDELQQGWRKRKRLAVGPSPKSPITKNTSRARTTSMLVKEMCKCAIVILIGRRN